MSHSDNKRIAKNTIFLYFRMLFTMGVTLYTSRVVLRVLGIEDLGIYSVVGGVVGMLSFLNGALSSSSSRFLTFELGTRDNEKLKRVFNTTLIIHIGLALLIALLSETIGLWFVYNKLIIPQERLDAAIFAYHFSILTALLTITQVPYNAAIIAHERMSIYAYMSIFEVLTKLLIVYLLNLGDYDNLKLYALLLFLVQFLIAMFYRVYCVKNFNETHFKFQWDKNIFKSIASFSGWSLFSNLSYVLMTQGASIVTNIFFSPAVVGARAISLQVSTAASSFVGNFRTAVNPQIVKLYADEQKEKSQKLLLDSTKYSFYLMFLLGFPIILEAKIILLLWLNEVPEYTVIFVQLAIIQALFSVIDTSLYTAFYVTGRIKENALISSITGFIAFPLIYILFKVGYSPVTLSYVFVCVYAILGLIIKPVLVCKIAQYRKEDVLSIFFYCFKVVLCSIPIPLLFKFLLPISTIYSVLICIIAVISVSLSILLVGIDSLTRNRLISICKQKIKNIYKK